MKPSGKNPFRGWRLLVSTLLTVLPTIAYSQGRPNILWAKAGHSQSVNSVAYSPDGRLLVSGSSDRTIKLWRQDGSFIRSLTINAGLFDVLSVAVSPDGTLIAAGVQQAIGGQFHSAAQIWRIPDGQLVQNFTGYAVGDSTTTGVTSVGFSPDGQYLATGCRDRSVKVWRLADGTLVSSRSDHAQKVNAVAFSPNGQWLASASDDRTAKLYRTSDWGLERTLTGHGDYVFSLAFSPNSVRLATGSWDQTVRIWNVIDGSLVHSLGHGSGILAVAFAPDGQTLASGAYDQSIKLWDPEQGVLVDTLLGYTASVLTLAFAPDSQMLASGSWVPDYAIRLWGPEGAKPSIGSSPIIPARSMS